MYLLIILLLLWLLKPLKTTKKLVIDEDAGLWQTSSIQWTTRWTASSSRQTIIFIQEEDQVARLAGDWSIHLIAIYMYIYIDQQRYVC